MLQRLDVCKPMAMAPKRRPDTAAAAEDYRDAVLLLASVSRVQLRLVSAARRRAQRSGSGFCASLPRRCCTDTHALPQGLHAAPELPAPVPLTDASEAPLLALELHSAGGGAPALASLPPLSADFSAPVPLVEHKFRYASGTDILDRLLNESLELRLVASGSRAVLAAACLDTLAFGLGSSVVEADALPLQPAAHDEPFKVRAERMRRMHARHLTRSS